MVGGEAFTAHARYGAWRNHPGALKALGDAAFCAGITQFVIHRWAMQPWLDRVPGMTYGRHGIHFDRTNTWFEQSTAWLDYIARSQSMLQQGLFVADVCYLLDEGAPQPGFSLPPLQPPPPRGYAYDACSPEMLKRMAATEQELVLPSGMRYRLLILPPNPAMTPELLRKVRDLVREGAHVLGPKPRVSPSLRDYPACDAEVKQLADELWGAQPEARSGASGRAFGRGRIYWSEKPDDILAAMRRPADFETIPLHDAEDIQWIHRRTDDADIYFVANTTNAAVSFDALFRVADRQPELWNPVNGQRNLLPAWESLPDGRTRLSLRLDQTESTFIIFRKRIGNADPILALRRDGKSLYAGREDDLSIHAATYGVSNDPARMVDVTEEIRQRARHGLLSLRVWYDIAGGDPAPGVKKTLQITYSSQGKQATASALDGERISLPEQPAPAPLVAELLGAPENAALLAWEAGDYEAVTANGRTLSAQIAALPEPLHVGGPWRITFPPALGAPPETTFRQLESWTANSEPGIRYFSGTATYHNKIDIPAEWLTSGRRVYLDLGDVRELAEVLINGQNLSILWKAPFRVDVTKALKPGENTLEIRVTNLWVNRLIGDEQKPPYLRWGASGEPAEWPQWLVAGAAVPDTGRITFTTWKHYDKDSPLLESGLLGPVTLRCAALVSLEETASGSSPLPE